jgi:hypothetical protein
MDRAPYDVRATGRRYVQDHYAAIAAFVACFFHANDAGAQQPNRLTILNLGDAVITGFSGTITPDATQRGGANKAAIDLTFINPDGPSTRIVDLNKPGYLWDGRLCAAPKTFDVLAKDIGQVFGLQIVGHGRDGLPNEGRMAKTSETSHEDQS